MSLSIKHFIFPVIFILSIHSNAQSLIIESLENETIRDLKIGDKLYIEFTDTIQHFHYGAVLKTPLKIKTTAIIESLNNSGLTLKNPWLSCFTEDNEHLINISAFRDMETDYSLLNISNKIALNKINLIKVKKEIYDKEYFKFNIGN